MAGLEILGAVAASVALTQACSRITQVLLGSSADGKLSDVVHGHCETLLREINTYSSELSSVSREAAQQLANSLQLIQENIERRRRSKTFTKLFHAVIRNRGDYKDQMMIALQNYQTRTIVSGYVTIEKIALGQTNISEKVEGVSRTILENLATLTADVGQLRIEEQGKKEKASEQRQENASTDLLCKALTETFRAEIATLRVETANSASVIRRCDMDRPDLLIDYGTMAMYLSEIRENGGWTSQQDMWECFYDIAQVWLQEDIEHPLLSISLKELQWNRAVSGISLFLPETNSQCI